MSFSIHKRTRVSIDCNDYEKYDEKTKKGIGEPIKLTEQSHKNSCDIHGIMRRYEKTGVLEHTQKYEGKYGGFPGSIDFQEHMNIIIEAEKMFMTVPAKIRAQFNNEPGEFVDYMQDDKNYDQIKEWGFDVSHMTNPNPQPAKKPEPQEVVIVNSNNQSSD
jgi:phage internal scaffolding protein